MPRLRNLGCRLKMVLYTWFLAWVHRHEYVAHLSMRSALSSVNRSKIKSPGRYVSSRASYELRYLLAGYKDYNLQAAHAYDTRLSIHSNNPCLSLIISLVIAWTEIYRGCLFCVRAIHAKWTYSNMLKISGCNLMPDLISIWASTEPTSRWYRTLCLSWLF